jgi:hypothetical protein
MTLAGSCMGGVAISILENLPNARASPYRSAKKGRIPPAARHQNRTKAIKLHRLNNLNECFGHSKHVAKLRRPRAS